MTRASQRHVAPGPGPHWLAHFFQTGDANMASATATLTPSPAAVPTAASTAALTLTNVLFEKKGAIAYVTVNRPKVLNALNTPTW